ncbi:site-2 protease family protein [Candidatus Woesearchaeota archaeon]|jgi:Zn-dependent protease/CBS domain-containing protein|nr:site-2 protease family protein [Candidatus Woesearchaeota archaeon]MBT4151401.1 site-2 protease family protein [Candidatus Woesearchaeota archaeon]MBT4247799.1 site-2 protease family protein [Candidatus Woesearchaeota archaeon]MBT4434223.1 site-2 protease family protein [Candidatus Woesearchaeota archaeon]MBT7332055.1 site-2 protease family protein [Candidatus Woesearchaeota archaeon]
MAKSLKVLRIFGIDVRLHYSWWFIFLLLTWSLATAYFPEFYQDASSLTYWLMGLSAAVLLFLSVLLHELSHSMVARAKNIKVESITLFFFGGVAGITKEDMKPSSEFLMAIAGPLFSLFLGVIFFLIHTYNGNGIVSAITQYLYQLNFILAAFNLVPGFPLDGGRAFRAILYAYYKDLRKATKIASTVGKIFAAFLIIIGVVGIFSNQGGGLWFILIGGFLYFIAGVSYQQVLVRQVLSKIKVSKLMNKKFKTLSPKMKLDTFMKSNPEKESYIVQGKGFKGILDLQALETLPSTLQQVVKLEQISRPLSQIKTLSKNETAYQAFRKIALQKLSAIPVVEKGKVVGIVTAKSIQNQLVLGMAFGKNIKR